MPRRLLLLIALCALTPLVRAHDPFVAELKAEAAESTLTFRLTLARSVAAYLAGANEAPRHYYAPERFATDQAVFEKAAAALCVLEIDGKPLAPLRATVESAAIEEGDISFVLVYDRAKATLGRARFVCPWLGRLPAAENYAATFVLRSGRDVLAGPSLLSQEVSAVEFALAP